MKFFVNIISKLIQNHNRQEIILAAYVVRTAQSASL